MEWFPCISGDVSLTSFSGVVYVVDTVGQWIQHIAHHCGCGRTVDAIYSALLWMQMWIFGQNPPTDADSKFEDPHISVRIFDCHDFRDSLKPFLQAGCPS